jgi:hypothetical protein
MTTFEILEELIQPDARVRLTRKNDRYHAELCEPKCDSKVTLFGLPDDAFIIKADSFPPPESIFRGKKGECSRADFVIISESMKVALYIELKKSKGSNRKIVQQLKGAQCLVAYCREIGQRFWNHSEFMSDFEHRFVSIGHLSMPKRKMRTERSVAKHDQPELMMKIDWPHHLEFNKLAS